MIKDMDSMTKYKHMMSVEESVINFINMLEEDSGTKISEEDKQWLFDKGEIFFNTYYIDMQVTVYLSTKEDKQELKNYFDKVQNTLGGMFAHIMLIEFKLHLLEKEFGLIE
jgi:hypothetical protein